MSKFDEFAEYLSNTEKLHLAMTRQLINNAYSEDVSDVIIALQADSDKLRFAVEKYVAVNRWHPVPLMMLMICAVVVLMTAYLFFVGKLNGGAGLMTFGVALVSFVYVLRANMDRLRAGKKLLTLLPGLACPAEVNNIDEIQKLTTKYKDVLANLKLNQNIRVWTMKDYLVVWLKLDTLR